jgi:hypothetical protein
MTPSAVRIVSRIGVLATAVMLATSGCSCNDERAGRDEAAVPGFELPVLADGPLTPEARRQVILLADSTGQTTHEAYRKLLRIGRDAIPALVEALFEPHHDNFKQNTLAILGQLGVASERALPHLEHFKMTNRAFMASVADRTIRQIEQSVACGLPGLPDNAEVHVVGRYRGKKELDVQLGESGHTVTEIGVVVDRTPHPIVLVLTAYDPVVWRVGLAPGADVAGVLVSGYHTQALVGIPESLPHRVISGEQSMGCKAIDGSGPEDAAEIERDVMALTGYGVDRIHGASPKEYFRIGGNPYVESSNIVYSHDLTLDDYPVYRGEIPAGPRGVEELARQGKIRLATREDIDAWIAGAGDQSHHLHPGGVYVVLEEITLPPGLYGGHSRAFIIPRNVPTPNGPKGHCRFFFMKDFSVQ